MGAPAFFATEKPLASRTVRLLAVAAALLALVGGAAAASAAPAAPASATATLTWHPFKLLNGWKSASMPKLVTGTPSWAIRNGVVYLRGAVTQTISGGSATFANLPGYARPAHNLYIHVYTSQDTPGIVYIGNAGALEAYDGNAAMFTSLSTVSYPTGTIKEHKLSLLNGWASSQPSYDTGDPSYAVSGGVVYLSGSLNSSGTTQPFAVLPKAARPAHPMFISVYTFDGAVGWLQIKTNGQIDALGPDAREYTSLANISYPVASTKWHNFTLTDGWTGGQHHFGTGNPAYAIINGIVYLSGSMYGPNAKIGLWTDLPKGVRTAADVLEIEVYTAKGSAGAVAVTSTLGLVSSMPFSNARQFTSLAAIAYPQSS